MRKIPTKVKDASPRDDEDSPQSAKTNKPRYSMYIVPLASCCDENCRFAGII
jgi:hypothetical protein